VLRLCFVLYSQKKQWSHVGVLILGRVARTLMLLLDRQVSKYCCDCILCDLDLLIVGDWKFVLSQKWSPFVLFDTRLQVLCVDCADFHSIKNIPTFALP